MTKRFLVPAVTLVAGVLLVRRAASHCGRMDFGTMIERMPDDAPPKWMFRNISAIRENSDRILELLEATRETPGTQAEAAAGARTS